MKITKQNIQTYAKRLLEVLKDENISSLEEALKVADREFQVREISSDKVHVHTRPSNLATTALKISYISPNFAGIPLELVINPELAYRQVILKCDCPIVGYEIFTLDRYENLVQFKKSRGAEWADSLKDVEELKRLS